MAMSLATLNNLCCPSRSPSGLAWHGEKILNFSIKIPRKPNFSSSFRTHHYFELHVGCWGGFKDRVRDLEAGRQAINFK